MNRILSWGAVPIEEEISRRGIQMRGRGPERSGPCPVCGGRDRFAINVRKQVFHCRVCNTGGDVIALVRHLDGCDFKTAVRTLGLEERPAPTARPAPPPPLPRGEDANGKRALAIWFASVPIAGTLADTYLRSRDLRYDGEWYHALDRDGEALRFHPRCPFDGDVHPCMVGLFRTIGDNKANAIHRTALTPEGRKIDRRTLGPIGGAAIKLTPDEDVTMGLHIGEGIETVLAAMALGFRPAWALGSAGGIAKFPVLSGIDALTILVDHDRPDARGRQAGHAAARECGNRWTEAGREVFYVVPDVLGHDMADVVGEAS